MFALSFLHIHFPSEKILLLALFSFSENENSNVVEFCWRADVVKTSAREKHIWKGVFCMSANRI